MGKKWLQKHRIVEVLWVKAHMSKEQVEGDGWDSKHWEGNKEADKLATQGIGMRREGLLEVKKFREKKKRLGEIQGYLLRWFKVLACRRGTRWGEQERVGGRRKGCIFC